MKIWILFFLSFVCFAFCRGQNSEDKRLTTSLRSVLISKKDSLIKILVSVKDLSEIHNDKDIKILSEYSPGQIALISIKPSKLSEWLQKGLIVFADLLREPKEELTTGSLDLNLNRINLAHHLFPDAKGDSIAVSIKEQRFDTSDIDIRGRYFESGVAAPAIASHASIMATIVAGGGNTSEFAKGAAPGALLTSSDFASLLPDADSVYRRYSISVQNHSYGTAIENYYGGDAAAFDRTVQNNPFLVHVFSSGNSGAGTSTTGTYSGIQGLANLTGSFKMAKNILTVGATDSFNKVSALSSKGPAYDGRIKPELVAFGEDGSSGAAALVSGTVAMMQEAYRSSHGYSLPSSALIKAAILNSADDMGSPHVDFSYGYGSLNAWKALTTIKENRFFESNVSQNESKNFTITVPQNIKQIKCTLVWTDPAAIANAPKALVNDLDAELQLGSENWKPWILNTKAHADSLLLEARRGVDTLNNIEQITIDDPQPGNYNLQIKGNKVRSGTVQDFVFAYQLDSSQFAWTFPTASDGIISGASNLVRWQTNIDDTASIEYSPDGLEWTLIARGVDLKKQFYNWHSPDEPGTGLLRISISAMGRDFVTDTFTVSRIMNMQVGFNCADSFLLFWKKEPVLQYQVYQLGLKYFEPAFISKDTFIVLHKQQYPALHYSVAPLLGAKSGLKSNATNYTAQGVGCYIRSFLVSLVNRTALLRASLGSDYGIASVSFQKLKPSGYITIQIILAPSLDLVVPDSLLTRGMNSYRMEIRLNNGSIVYSNVETVYYFPDLPVIAYPNPVRENEPVRIIAQEAGVYSVMIYDAEGRLVRKQVLEDVFQQIPPLYLSKGMYLVKIISSDGKTAVQKLVVY